MGDDTLGFVDIGDKGGCFPYPPPDFERKKMFKAIKRTIKFFLSLVEKIERGEDV